MLETWRQVHELWEAYRVQTLHWHDTAACDAACCGLAQSDGLAVELINWHRQAARDRTWDSEMRWNKNQLEMHKNDDRMMVERGDGFSSLHTDKGRKRIKISYKKDNYNSKLCKIFSCLWKQSSSLALRDDINADRLPLTPSSADTPPSF